LFQVDKIEVKMIFRIQIYTEEIFMNTIGKAENILAREDMARNKWHLPP
jgi:hypothetical protein